MSAVADLAARPTSRAAVTPLTAAIGAEITGLDLRTLRDDGAVTLRSAVDRHQMVVVRDQHLTADELASVAEVFGPILPSPVHQVAGRTTSAVNTIEDTAARPPAGFDWHTDVSWSEDAPAFGFLSAVVIPPFGGDTLWASTSAIYDSLDDANRRRCTGVDVVHAPDETLFESVARHHGDGVVEALRTVFPGIRRSLVTTHPRTGRQQLSLSPMYTGCPQPDPRADDLLAMLRTNLDDPLVQVRWRWRAGDVVIWDEAATCHRALTDHYPQRRLMQRCVTGAW